MGRQREPEEPMAPDDQERVLHVIDVAFGGVHHVMNLRYFGTYATCGHYGELATFDGDQLTRLVVAAHDQGVRVALQQGGPRQLTIVLSPRKAREGNIVVRHPTLEGAVARYRRTPWMPSDPPAAKAADAV